MLIVLFEMIRQGMGNFRLNYYLGLGIVIGGFLGFYFFNLILWRSERNKLILKIDNQDEYIELLKKQLIKNKKEVTTNV
jgi:hypothetical protein